MYIHNTYTIKVQEFSVTSTRIRCKSISLPYFFHDIPLYKIETIIFHIVNHRYLFTRYRVTRLKIFLSRISIYVYYSISGYNDETRLKCLHQVKPRISGRRITKGIRSDINRNPTLIPLYNAHYLILSCPRLSATIRQIRYDSIIDRMGPYSSNRYGCGTGGTPSRFLFHGR